MNNIIKKYKDWKANPEDYGYDSIGEFITDFTEEETVEFMECVEKLSGERSNCNIPQVIHCTNCNSVNLGIDVVFNHKCKDCNEVFD